jgi:ribonuclease HII
MPDYQRERAAGGRVAGIDEVGRGPLAGPVVAAAVMFHAGVPRRLARLINDSKQLDAAQRQAAYDSLLASGAADIAIGAASVSEIARINILQASLLAMCRAVARLRVPPDLALVDGNRPPRLNCRVECVIDGDALCLSIAAASIVAKVTRDRAMQRLHPRFPDYGWHSNAGYGTPDHRAALHRLGPTVHHRAGFGTVREIHAARAAQAELAFAACPL